MEAKSSLKSKKTSKTSKKSSGKSSRGVSTMSELLEQYGSARGLSIGDMIEGVILEITSKRVVFDIGGKSEGMVAEKAFKEAENFIKTLKVGDKLQAKVLVPETQEGFTILSLRQASSDASWKKLEKLKNDAIPVKCFIRVVNPSGLIVDFDGFSGFITKSQLGKEILKETQNLVGTKIEAVVIDLDRKSNKIILSEKEVSEKEQLEFVKKALKVIKEGDIFVGEVTSVYDFGCFVKICVPLSKKKKDPLAGRQVFLEGLVHISELSWDKIDRPSNLVSQGDKVKVKVIGKLESPGRQAGKLALSIKQAQKDPWQNIEKKYKKDGKVSGKVVKISGFGTFVSLEPGVEGLIHITKIPPGKKLIIGEKVNVYIEEVDKKSRRISLGLVLTEKPVGYK